MDGETSMSFLPTIPATNKRILAKKLSELRDHFYDSSIPYKVDVVDFDAADGDFREHVLHNEPIVWIR